MKIIDFKMNEIKSNDKGDLHLKYNIKCEDYQNIITSPEMTAKFDKHLDILTETERPQGIRPQQIEKAILHDLIERKLIK